MEKTRMTKKEYFGEIRAIVEGVNVDNRDEILEFIDRQVELLSRKANSTNTKKAQEIAETVEVTFNALAEIGRPATATEVAEKLGVSNQKASAYLKKLVEAGKAVKTVDKKKSFFSIED